LRLLPRILNDTENGRIRFSANTTGRAKNAHAFARVEDVTLCPSQD
jgi:hypothetical protein